MADARRGGKGDHRPVWSEAQLESLARAIHGEYVRAESSRAQPITMAPAAVSWDELPETLRISCRDQAVHILDKLDAVACDVRPATGEVDDLFRFNPDEVQFLARLEHQRWVDERRRNGWVQGPRDPMRRTTPYLVPWDKLPEEIREYDRMFVRRIPVLLMQQGYGIVRRAPQPE